jgi:hypothetical protein
MSSLGFQQNNQGNRPYPAADEKTHKGGWNTPEGWTAIFTGVLTLSTIGLWWATYRIAYDQKQTSKRVRAIVRGGGLVVGKHLDVFRIDAFNAGAGTAAFKKISWGFRDYESLPDEPPYREIAAADSLAPNQGRPAKFVRLPYGPYRRLIVSFRFDYHDVVRDREEWVKLAMEVYSEVPEFPVHLGPGDIPAEYLGESTPIAGESLAPDWA